METVTESKHICQMDGEKCICEDCDTDHQEYGFVECKTCRNEKSYRIDSDGEAY